MVCACTLCEMYIFIYAQSFELQGKGGGGPWSFGQIHLRVELGFIRKSSWVPNFLLYCIFMTKFSNFSKSPPPLLSPPSCVHLWLSFCLKLQIHTVRTCMKRSCFVLAVKLERTSLWTNAKAKAATTELSTPHYHD